MELCDFNLGQYVQDAETSSLAKWETFRQHSENICDINWQIIEGLISIHNRGEGHRILVRRMAHFSFTCIPTYIGSISIRNKEVADCGF